MNKKPIKGEKPKEIKKLGDYWEAEEKKEKKKPQMDLLKIYENSQIKGTTTRINLDWGMLQM